MDLLKAWLLPRDTYQRLHPSNMAGSEASTVASSDNEEPRKPNVKVSETYFSKLKLEGAAQSEVQVAHDPLQNDIHPIWDYSNWHPQAFSYEDYQKICPALHLASRFINGDTYAIDFLVRITHATPIRDPSMTGRFNMDHIRISPAMIAQTRKILDQMAHVIRFYDESHGPLVPYAAAATAIRLIVMSNDPPPFRHPKPVPTEPFQNQLGHQSFPPKQWIATRISNAILDAVLDPDIDDFQYRRACFSLSATLVHELCHAIWRFTRGHGYSTIMIKEPCVDLALDAPPDLDLEFELGNQWEVWMFGSVLFSALFLPMPGATPTESLAKRATVAVSDDGTEDGTAKISESDYEGTNVSSEASNTRTGNRKIAVTTLPRNPVFMNTDKKDEYQLVSQEYIDRFFTESLWRDMRSKGRTTIPESARLDLFLHMSGGGGHYRLTDPQSSGPAFNLDVSKNPKATSSTVTEHEEAD